MKLTGLISLIVFIVNVNVGLGVHDGLYKLLGVGVSASTREIRQAFKKLALAKHPDKNADDPNANDVFMRINRAYEILKDDDLRKKYDQHGEDALNNQNNNNFNNFQNWNFYQQNFGIYDDDAEIVTLSRTDFMQSVDGSTELWFINFYSTMCSHCHELAPTWRSLAKELDGVVRIGAINCMDDWQLCNEQQIGMFPLLIIYPRKQVYQQAKSLENLVKFALSHATGAFARLTTKNFDGIVAERPNKQWFITFCSRPNVDLDGDDNFLDDAILKKIAVMLNGLVNVGMVDCKLSKPLCVKLKPVLTSANLFFDHLKAQDEQQDRVVDIGGLNHKDVASAVMHLLPDLTLLDRVTFNRTLDDIKQKRSRPWLIQFVHGYDPTAGLDLRKLPMILANDTQIGRVDCKADHEMLDICKQYSIVKYPTFVLFKRRGLYEHHFGRQTAHDLASFARDNGFTNLKSLTSADFPRILQADKPAFIDFFTPWCPPCMRLLPEFRKAAKQNGKHVNFGIVDCTIEVGLCNQYNIHSYPTTIMFNQSNQHYFRGDHTANDLNRFIEDIMNPTVHTLNYNMFHESVIGRARGHLWLVDFYMPWCGPCMQMAPAYRELAKKLRGTKAFVAKVDCQTEQHLCHEQNVHMYPQIRLYAPDSSNPSDYHVYGNQMSRDTHSFYIWAQQFMPNKRFERSEL